jgi:hypothetical protein
MTDTDQDQDQVRSLIDRYLVELERQGRGAPLPLQALASLPEPARAEATFTLRLMRACWNAGPDQAGQGTSRSRWWQRRPR